MKEIGKEKSQSLHARPPTCKLSAKVSDEYDPTFFHLRRSEHQHVIDTIARLRRQILSNATGSGGKNTQKCLPLLSAPLPAHLCS